MSSNDFPVLDAPRADSTVLDAYGMTEPYVDEMDHWVPMPVRLTYSQGQGFCIEVGPYTFAHQDIAVLRRAIIGYEQATRPA